MNDAISRSALLEVGNVRQVTEYDEAGYYMTYNAVPVNVIEALPALDVAPVVHARWQEHHCTNCWAKCVTAKTPQDFVFNVETPYCPNCGARTDGEAE